MVLRASPNFLGAALVVTLLAAFPAPASAKDNPADMARIAIQVCNAIAGAQSADAVQKIVKQTDKVGSDMEAKLPGLQTQLSAAKADAKRLKNDYEEAEFEIERGGSSNYEGPFASSSARGALEEADKELGQAYSKVYQLQREIDADANLLTALTFAGLSIQGCADARLEKLGSSASQSSPPASENPPTPPPAPPSTGGCDKEAVQKRMHDFQDAANQFNAHPPPDAGPYTILLVVPLIKSAGADADAGKYDLACATIDKAIDYLQHPKIKGMPGVQP